MTLKTSQILTRNLTVSPLGGVRLAGFAKNGVGVLSQNRTLNHFTIVYVVNGNGVYVDDTGAECEVQPGDFILVKPNVEHWYGPEKGNFWDEIYIAFEGPVFDLWLQEGCLAWPRPVQTLKPIDYWMERMIAAAGESHHGDPTKMIAESLELQLLLRDLLNASRVNVDDEIAWLKRAKTALAKQENVHAAAAAMNIPYEAFRKRFRKLARVSPGRFRTAILMEQACELLSTDDVTVKVIADRLGYCDEYHFSKQFSKTIGWSPSEYRARVSTN